MILQLRRAIALVLAVMASSNSPTMAGPDYSASATCDIAVSISDTSTSAWSYLANINQVLSGSYTGNGTFANTATGGSQNLLPLPLFPGEFTFAGTTGSSGLPGGSASSSAFNESSVSIFETNATIIAFSLYTSINASYQTDSPEETASANSSVTVLFNGSQVYDYLSSMGTGGNSGLMYVYAPAGLSTFLVETSASGSAFEPTSLVVPEPASIVMMMVFGGIAFIGYCVFHAQRR